MRDANAALGVDISLTAGGRWAVQLARVCCICAAWNQLQALQAAVVGVVMWLFR